MSSITQESESPLHFDDDGLLRESSRWQKAMSSLRKDKSALFGVLILLAVVLCAILAPVISPANPHEQLLSRALKPPLWSDGQRIFILGTDHLGRDFLSRLIYGTRISLMVGFFAVFLTGSVGLLVGLLSGYFGGKVDFVFMRLVDLILSFPFILLALATIAIVGPSLTVLILVMSMRIWVIYARVVRGEVLSLREQEFVQGARSIGSSHVRIIFRHILPNVLAPVIIIASLYLGRMIIIEAGLSFLGLGVPPPTPTWGGLLSDGKVHLYTAWWVVTFPGLAITITVLGSNLVGDWLRNVLDPRLQSL
ncbi:MAG: ABC transporter permease [Nitrospinaceae bacterium]|jgi:peptide/nickel transport system permease protein|nr:ABC transporter permease [Nitrospinaceae bacterium]MBT3433331.1 ABC transporter permease [Nitrospinaceae bacterium]MBT3820447.1 ABC transporter permease [Nitrospinaceae bacterium]MBT4093787.1 ABC transporter permease [Nitrospinaceae bacterium]MBT4429556.1 ABC transporter permease [Nitrospinaceae bacterium]